MNPYLQARGERRRTRRLHRPSTPTAELPHSIVASIWPPAHPTRFTPMRSRAFRTVWTAGRDVAAKAWPSTLDPNRRPLLWRLARIIWTTAALVVYAITTATSLAAVLAQPARWIITNGAGYLLVTAGWSPPLTDANLHHLADPKRAIFDDDHEHTHPTPTPQLSPTDAREDEWVDPVEREQRRAVEADARHERQTAALEALTQPTPTSTAAPALMPAPVYSQTPLVDTRAHQPVSLRRWVLRALVIMSLISATGLLITAWTLAALSAGGVTGEPPTNAELIDEIHTRTEQRTNDIADQLAEIEGEQTP